MLVRAKYVKSVSKDTSAVTDKLSPRSTIMKIKLWTRMGHSSRLSHGVLVLRRMQTITFTIMSTLVKKLFIAMFNEYDVLEIRIFQRRTEKNEQNNMNLFEIEVSLNQKEPVLLSNVFYK